MNESLRELLDILLLLSPLWVLFFAVCSYGWIVDARRYRHIKRKYATKNGMGWFLTSGYLGGVSLERSVVTEDDENQSLRAIQISPGLFLAGYPP